MIDKLVLYQKLYDLILYAFPIINRFPKSQKFVLGKQIENVMINMLVGTVHANNATSNIIFNAPNHKGIPIGNLTSQLFANIYLNKLDHFIKEILQLKYYIRYMDDFIVLCDDKQRLKCIWQHIEMFLNSQLKLDMNEKTNIFPINQGINFLGYRIWPTHKLLRKRSVKRMRRGLKYFKKQYLLRKMCLEDINKNITGWVAHAQHANTYYLRVKLSSECSEIEDIFCQFYF